MQYENLIVEKDGSTAVVALNRPKALNALNSATLKELDAAVDELAADSDFVFVLLPGQDEGQAKAAGKLVDDVLKKISARGVRAGAFTLGTDAHGCAQLVQRFSLESFPSVVAMGRGCGAVAVTAEITEAKLLRAFVLASAPRSSWGTGGRQSGCCP